MSRLAVHPDAAAALLDDPVDGGEPQPGALALLLGRKERLEDVGLRALVHAAAGVAHRHQHVRAGGDGEEPTGIGLVQLDVGGFDGEPPPVGHGVAGIDGQVHDHLLDLARIGKDAAQLRMENGMQFDVFPDHRMKHPLHVGHHRVELQHLWLKHLLAAERQKLTRQGRGPAAGCVDFLDLNSIRGVGPEATQEELAVPVDDRQQVVEVVGDASREAPDRLYLLGLAKRFLAGAQRLLHLLALKELADLEADFGYHLDRVTVRLTDIPAEELDDAVDVADMPDRKAACCAQSRLGRERRPWKVGINNDVRNPVRFCVGPHAPRQTDAGRECHLPAFRRELRGVE